MRVLLFLTVFSFAFVNLLQAFDVEGDVNADVESEIKNYYENYGQQKTEKLLEYLGYDLYIFDNNSVRVTSVSKIASVDFKGNLAFLDSTLQIAAAIAKGDPLYADTLQSAAHKLETFYISSGYKNVKIDFQTYGENVVFEIKEGKLFLITDISVTAEEYDKDYRFINPIIFNDETINKYVNEVETFYRKLGYFNVETEVNYKENDKTTFFLKLDNPFLSVLSFIPIFHKSVSVEIDVKKGEYFDLRVKNTLKPELEKDIKERTGEFLKGVNSFDLRSAEGMLKDYLRSKGFMFPSVIINYDEDGDIVISVDFQRQVREIKLNIYYENLKDNTFVEEYNISKKILSNKQSERIKSIITSYLQKKGYLGVVIEKIDFNINNGDMNVTIKVNEGKKYKVDNVYAGGEKVFSGVKASINRSEIIRLKKLVDEKLRKKFFYNFLSFKDYKLNENDTADIVFEADLLRLELNKIICRDAKLRESFGQLFMSNSTITKEKVDIIKNYMAKQKNYNNYTVEIIQHENNRADIVISGYQSNKNEIFGGFSYDSVDLLNIFGGYRRYDIMGSGHQLQLFSRISSREQAASISVSGYRSLESRIEEIYSLGWKMRDESDFEYEQYRAGALYLKRISRYMFSAGMFGENLSFQDLDYEQSIKDRIEEDFSLLGIPLSVDMQSTERDEKSFLHYSGQLSVTPVLEFGGSSFVTIEWKNVVKKYVTNNIRLRLGFDAGYNTGDTTDVPLTYLYTLGGPGRMKAFDYRDIGSEDSGGNVYGGDRFYYTIVGIDYELANNVFIGPFFEYGDALESWKFDDGYKDIGIALTADTPLGSLGLSLAYEIGGSGKSDYAFYLSLESSF